MTGSALALLAVLSFSTFAFADYDFDSHPCPRGNLSGVEAEICYNNMSSAPIPQTNPDSGEPAGLLKSGYGKVCLQTPDEEYYCRDH